MKKTFRYYLEQVSKIQDLPFIDEIEKEGGFVAEVGGRVRDSFLGIDSKDLDLVVFKISQEKLIPILQKYGNLKVTGNKFPVIKWTQFGSKEEIDIALPRIERKVGTTRNDFEFITSPNIKPEEDLYRRDFTMNAILRKINGDIFDPFNGLFDIQNKIIRMINPESFSPEKGDELRMLRAVQFAARFGFKIEEKTLKAIRENAYTIKKLSKDRIIEEMKKILKGSIPLGVSYLVRTKLFNFIFDLKKVLFPLEYFKLVSNFSEFLFLLTYGNNITDLASFLKDKIKIDNLTQKDIKCLQFFFDNYQSKNTPQEKRLLISECFKISPIILETKIITQETFKKIINEFKNKKYPISLNELKINGNDLSKHGFSGKKIKETLDLLLSKVYSDEIKNEHIDLMNFVLKI